MNNERIFHPAATNTEVLLPGSGTLCIDSGGRAWRPFLREGLLRRVGPAELLITWTTGGVTEPADGNVTRIARSTDNGRTWEDAGLFRHPTRGLFTTELFCPNDGAEVHAFINTYPFGSWMTQLLSYRAISRDGGRTWDGPHSIPGGIQNVWPNRGIKLSTGAWLIPMSWAELIGEEWAEPAHGRAPVPGQVGARLLMQTEVPFGTDTYQRYHKGNEWADRNHRYCVGVMRSDDQGRTFGLHGHIAGGVAGHLIEPRVVELADGRIVMLIRSQKEGFLLRSESRDGGLTWTPAVRTDIMNPSAKVNILKARDGRIFLIHNPVGHQGNIMGGRNPLSLWISDDGMQTWRVKVDLVKDSRPNMSLNYPDGFLDEAAGELVFCWEDTEKLFVMRVPMEITSLNL